MTLEERIFRCWLGGNSIGETREAVARACGARPSFEDVRRRFVALADRFYQQSLNQ